MMSAANVCTAWTNQNILVRVRRSSDVLIDDVLKVRSQFSFLVDYLDMG